MSYNTSSPAACRLGTMLRTLRHRDQLTQAEAAGAVGVYTQTLASWEQGRCLPDAVNLLRLMRLYSIDPVDADRVLAGDAYVPPKE